jgi:phosphoglycolate phosphatase
MIRVRRQFDPALIRLLVFDLDGTLIDSRLDLVNSVNAALRFLERPELPPDVIASLVGDGAPVLVRRALGDPVDEALVERGLEFFLAFYREHKLDHTQLYSGIPEALQQMRGNHGAPRRMAVLTNKPVHPSRAIVHALGVAAHFPIIYGGNSFSTKKPDPLGLQTIMQEIGAQPEETLMIGDSAVDILTGHNARTWTVGVTYGFAPHTLAEAEPDITVDSPAELAQILGG